MTTVIFYEKPGCINNNKQKTLLKAAGHQVQAHSLLTEPWTEKRLRSFFGDRPVAEWFNPSAPRIKSGEIDPKQMDARTALVLMVRDPLLIRRPLIQVGDRQEAGFDIELIDNWIGLKPVDEGQKSVSENLISQDLQNCPRSHQ